MLVAFYFIYLTQNRIYFNYFDFLFIVTIFCGLIYSYFISNNTYSHGISTTVLIIYIFYRFGFDFYPSQREKPSRVITVSVYFYIFVFIFIFLDYFFNLGIVNPVYTFKDGFDYLVETGTTPVLSGTGLSLSRTSWALGLVFISIFFIDLKKLNYISLETLNIYLVAMFLSQIVTNSKFGLSVSFVILALHFRHLIFSSYFKLYASFLMGICCFILVLLNDSYFRIQDGQITTGRFEGWLLFPEIISQHFIEGWGSEVSLYTLRDFGLAYSHIHNSWMHLIAVYGIIGLTLTFIYFLLLIITIRKSLINNQFMVFSISVIGLINTMIEPDSIISYGYNVLVFWYMVGNCKNTKILQRSH